ncbi:MAG: hypothetical protein AB7I33_13500 [Gemmatimonadales bacterium]
MSPRILFLLITGPAVVVPLSAQQTFQGLILGLEVIRTPAWSFDEQIPGSSLVDHHDIPAASGLELRAAWAVVPYVAPFAAASVSLHSRDGSDLSGFTTVSGGIEGRLPGVAGALVPTVELGLGHLSWSGGLSYTYALAGAGVDLFAVHRVALHAGVQAGWPLGDGTRDGRNAVLDADVVRLSAGVRIALGRRR